MLLRLTGFEPLLEPLSADDFAPPHGEMRQSRYAVQLATKGILNVRFRAAKHFSDFFNGQDVC